MQSRWKHAACAITTTICLNTPCPAQASGQVHHKSPTSGVPVAVTFQTLDRPKQNEGYPFGWELLLCMASAKLDGASLSDAYGQCTVE